MDQGIVTALVEDDQLFPIPNSKTRDHQTISTL
jgi:hypothetical protein